MTASSLSSLSLRPVLRGWRALATTLTLTFLAALLSLGSIHLIHSMRFIFFTTAVLASSWLCGFRHGLLSILLSATVADLYLMETSHLGTLNSVDLMRIAMWMALAAGIVFLLSNLRKAQIHEQEMLDRVAEGFCVLDANWKIVYLNSFGENLVGKAQGDVVGQNYWEAFPQTVGTAVEQQYRRCAAERVPAEFDYRPASLGRWLRIRAYPFHDGLSVFFQDVSQAKAKEEQLRAMLERLSAAHKAAQIGTWELNIKTQELLISEEIPALYGLGPKEFDNRVETFFRMVHPEDMPMVRARMRKAIENKEEYYAEFRVSWPNGETRWMCGQGQVVLDDAGNPARVIGITMDITQRHLHEETLRRTEKLATAGRLAATIAHEINNPLEAVTNLIYLLRQSKELKPEQAALLRLADEQLARVNHIAKQTLAFYRDSNVAEPVNIIQTIEELLAFLSARITSKQVLLVKEFERVRTVYGYPSELRQALSNLLSNALDASLCGGKMIVRVGQERSEDGEIVGVRIEIEDFGNGIPPADRPHIFEPFFTTKADVGTGLGLWISKQLVEKRGGRLEFRSACPPGDTGTCFAIIMPGSARVAMVA